MYTEGIRKILTVDYYKDLNDLCGIASRIGAKAFVHNGRIFVYSEAYSDYVQTCFTIDDFKTT